MYLNTIINLKYTYKVSLLPLNIIEKTLSIITQHKMTYRKLSIITYSKCALLRYLHIGYVHVTIRTNS